MTAQRSVILLGGGGHAAVVAEAARSAGWTVAGYLDDDAGAEPAARTVGLDDLGRLDAMAEVLRELPPGIDVHAAVGDPDLRRELLDAVRDGGGAGRSAASIVHVSAIVSPSADIGSGVFIGPGAIVNARARIERGAIVNSGAIVEHDCVLGPFAHVAPAAVLAGAVVLGESSLLGAGSAVQPGLRIGRDVRLGAGSVVTTDIPDGVRAAGAPARELPAPSAQAAR